MRALALVALCGCSQIFGLHAPARGDGGDAPIDSSTTIDRPPGACVTQPDCPTSACLPDGSCAAGTDVAWLDPASTVTTPCTMAVPCYRLLDALQTGRPYIRVHGAITNLSGINRAVMIFGEPGASFGQPGSQLGISAATAIYDLRFAGACVQVNSSGAATLVRVTIDSCNQYGINAQGPLTLDRSTIRVNKSGGILLNANGPAQFTITNSFIVNNGAATGSSFGGIGITASSVDPTSRLELNTIANNSAKLSGSSAGGLYCNDPGFSTTGNLIVQNTLNGDPTQPNANTLGICGQTDTIVQTDYTGLAFKSPMTGDYHLTAGSTAIDSPSLTSTVDHDFDGETRPYGAGYDIGADEYHP